MSTWFERGTFYHMYPLGMTGAPFHHEDDLVTHRFDELETWIPHMQALGCNALYIGPLFESSSHGYDTKDFKLVDKRLGDNNDFTRFVSLCHDANIKVVVDGVFNHTGREFFAFSDIQTRRESSPYRYWYKNVYFGEQITCDSWQGHWELPTLNLPNPEVKQYLFDVVRFWIETFDIDGIRLDCANVLDFGFMNELRMQTNTMKPDFWLMGEVIHGEYSRWMGDSMLHSVTNYELHKSLYSGLNDHNFFEIAHNVRRLEAIGTTLYTFLDNHDENRIASKLSNKQHLTLAYTLLFTLPGIPSIYYGGEWGIEGMRTRESDDALRPTISLNQTAHFSTDLLPIITKLCHIHTEYDAFHGGRYQELLLTNRQYAFSRHGTHSVVITAVNNDDQEAWISIPLPCHATCAKNLMDHSILSVESGKLSLNLPSNSGAILELRED